MPTCGARNIYVDLSLIFLALLTLRFVRILGQRTRNPGLVAPGSSLQGRIIGLISIRGGLISRNPPNLKHNFYGHAPLNTTFSWSIRA